MEREEAKRDRMPGRGTGIMAWWGRGENCQRRKIRRGQKSRRKMERRNSFRKHGKTVRNQGK